MLRSPVGIELPDPMHLEGWEETDEPLASNLHYDEQTYCFYALRYLLNPDGHYVSMERWLRMDPANSKDKLLPDLLIARDVLDREWDNDEYLPWEVGKPPELLAEILSPSSEDADKEQKPRRYGGLGVREYFLFDPDGTYGVPRIQGWTLLGERERRELPRSRDGGVASRVVPVRFVLVDNHIGVVDTRTGQLALTYAELQHLLRQEIEARQRALREAEALRERLRQEAQARQQEAEMRERAEQERRCEAAGREAAEAELRRVQAELDRLRGERG